MTLVELIARVISRRGDAVAIEDRTRRLSYAQLDAHSNALARRLRATGFGPENLVGICTRPSIETFVAMLGVLRAGGAFVLLDISYPAQRVAAMLADSRVGLVLVDSACCGAPVLAGTAQLRIDEDGPAGPPVAARVAPSNLAYVVFTSGSTGRPKGVAVTHAGLANLIERQIETFEIDEASRVLQFASLGFDAVISEAFTALCAGATLCVEDRGVGSDIADLLARRAITVVTLPPSLLRVLPVDDLPALRTVVSAGEACSADIVSRWAHGRRMINAYGPSECTVCATMKTMAGPADIPTIGRAMTGVHTYVLDDALSPVGPGDTGELHLGGSALARGYIGQPGLTAERFVPDPFAGNGARIYRTGDMVRRAADDELEFLGRSDEQVKIRGFRVEPREVEAALRELHGVDDVLVVARERSTGDVALVAYVVSQAGRVGEQQLLEFARERLPHFLRPTKVIVVAQWPRSPNGKIDRAALAGSSLAQRASAPAVTPTERRIEAIVCDLLDLDSVDLDRSFFQQGGDSIAAVRLALAIGAAFARKLAIGTLFECPTLRDLAAHVARVAEAPQSASAPTIVRLREGQGARQIWLPAPVHGNAVCYMRFASALGRDLGCYGLQTPGIDGEAEPIADFVALAAHQIRTIREHQPAGPYALGGWSMGGSLAFEIATQLQQAGEVVSHLVLMGATPPSADHLEAARATMKGYETWRMAYFYLRSLAFSLGLEIPLDFDELSQSPDDVVLERFAAQVRTLGPLGADVTTERAVRWLGIVRASLYGFQHHVPSGKFGGRTLIVRTTGANPLEKDSLVRARAVPPGRWDELLTGSVESLDVAANHYTLMLEPWVGEVATIVDRWLRSNP